MKWAMDLSRRLETDAIFQFKFNAFFVGFWLVTMLILPFVRILWGTVPALIIEEVSLWANFATHFAGMSSGLAAIGTQHKEPASVQEPTPPWIMPQK